MPGLYFGLLALGLGIGTGLAAQGCGQGQGRTAAAALEGVARQPEAAGQLQVFMLLGLAMIESLTIFAFVTFIMLRGYMPTEAQVGQLLGSH